MSEWRALETQAVIRGLAIVLVVANHSLFGVSLHGGLNALVVLTGLSLAQFSFSGTTRDILHAMMRFGLRVAAPSFVLALVWQLGVGEIYLPELAFYSNWLSTSRISLFPIWYPQALTQMLLVIGLVFLATDMGARIASRPFFWVGIIYLISISVAILSLLVWDSSHLDDKLPHFLAWNFFFGCFIWAVRKTLSKKAARIVLTFTLAVSIAGVFLLAGANNGMTRALMMPLLVLPLIWMDRVQLPPLLARATMILSQSTFFIFLFHYYAFWVIWRIGRAIGLEAEAQNPFLRLVVGVVGPIVLWVLCEAAIRVYRRGYRFLPLHPRM